MEEKKYKVGDTLKVISRGEIKDGGGHGFKVGAIITVIEVNAEDYYCKNRIGEKWYMLEHEVEPYIKK